MTSCGDCALVYLSRKVVMDELMPEGGDLNLFTQYSHHLNVTVFYLFQDMFPKGKYANTILRNARYIVVFKNPQDNVTMCTLLTQMYLILVLALVLVLVLVLLVLVLNLVVVVVVVVLLLLLLLLVLLLLVFFSFALSCCT